MLKPGSPTKIVGSHIVFVKTKMGRRSLWDRKMSNN